MIYMHSYTFRDYPIERALRKAREYGFDGVELSPCHWGWSHAEMQRRFDEIFAAADKVGIPIACVDFGGDFLSADPGARQAAVEGLKALLPRVKSYGATIVNGGAGAVLANGDYSAWNENGSSAATEEHWQRAADAFKQVAEVAERTGVLVTFEIHMNALHDTAAAAVRLLESIGSDKVKAALDAGNMLPLKKAEPADQAVKVLGKHLGYMHLKNCRMLPGGVADYNVPLDGGHIDMFKVALALKEAGYAGDYCIEYCGLGDASPKAESDIRYWRSLLAEAGAWNAGQGAR